MSIIHEALRKVQRQRGEQRDLEAHRAVRVVAGRRDFRLGGIAAAAAVAAGVVLAGLAWKEGLWWKEKEKVPEAKTAAAHAQGPAVPPPVPARPERRAVQDALEQGWEAYRKGDLARAERAFRAAIAADPDSALAHNNLGVVLRAQGRLPEAIGAYREAVRLQPEYADALGNLGSALAHQGRDREAVEHLTRAVRNAPGQPGWHLNLAVVLDRLKERKKAAAHYRRYLELAGSISDAKVQEVRQRLAVLEAGE